VRFRSGAVDTFGCSTRQFSGPFVIFTVPEAGGYLQKTVYLSISEIASLTVIESPQAPAVPQQPQPQPQPQQPVFTTRAASPMPPAGPVVYEARKVAALGVRETAIGPESQIVDEHGNVVTVNAGFMS
jgi:hypothetical protein